MLFRSQRLVPSLACAPLPRQARHLADVVRSRRPSAETVRQTWRASKGLLHGEDAASDELLLVCTGEEGGAEGAASAAALAAAALAAAAGG